MRAFTLLVIGSLLAGQLGGITVFDGVVVYVHDALLVVLLLVACIRWVRKRRWVRPKLMAPVLGFFVVGAVSLMVNAGHFSLPEIGVSSLYLVRWGLYALLYVFLIQGDTPSRILLASLFIVGSAFSILGIVQYFLYPSLQNLWYLGWDPHYWRLFSTFLDPNFAGVFIVLTIFLGVSMRQHSLIIQSQTQVRKEKDNYIHRIWWGVAQAINLVSLYLTHSRSGYIAFAAGALAWAVLGKQWKVLTILVLFALAIFLIPTPGGNTLRLFRMDSTVSRVENWMMTYERILESPLIGHGFNTLRFRPIYSPPGDTSMVGSKAAGGADSSILFLLVTTGLAGLVVYAFLINRMIQQNTLLLVSWVIIVAHSLFVNSLFYPWIMLWLWIIAATSELTLRE